MVGSVLGGRYLIEEEIGSGGMGAVYRGVDLRTGGKVAVKLPHPWLEKDSTFMLRLRREAEIAASLTNPRIVRVIDFDTWEGVCGKDGQAAPVGSGSPTLRIARITVGGTGG